MVTFNFNNELNELSCRLMGRMSADKVTEISSSIQKKITEQEANIENPDQLKVNFDLQEVDYIASSFIRICVIQAKKLDKGNFKITNASPLIKKTFKIAGLDGLLNVS